MTIWRSITSDRSLLFGPSQPTISSPVNDARSMHSMVSAGTGSKRQIQNTRCVQVHHRKGDRDREHCIAERLQPIRFALGAFKREYRHLTLQHFKWTTVEWPRKCRVERRNLGIGKNDIGGRAVLPHMCD